MSTLAYEGQNLVQRYGGREALALEHLEVSRGETVLLTGPNGCGKSTLLRLLAFLEQPVSGTLRYGGSADGRREATLLLQDPYLLRMSVFSNVVLGLKLRHEKADLKQAFERCMKAAGFADPWSFAERGPRELSGGERQRVALASRLALLGMPNVRFRVELGQRKEVGPSGQDTVTFLFSANKNGQLQNITSVASGGEIARVMLSVKAMIAGAVQLPTIVFDEIDTGVSGEIADRMADIMHEMGAANRQVISITHLPQIAARGAAHYKVYKEDNDTETNSHIRLLTAEERVEELAHMLSGATLTEAALNNARALLQLQPTKNKKKNG